MINLLAKQYNLSDKTTHYVPLDVVSVRLDYNFYLFQAGEEVHVVVETDYLSGLPGIVREVEETFGVKAIGWCARKDRKLGGSDTLLSVEADDYDPEGANGVNHSNYLNIVYTEGGLRYAVLKVGLRGDM